MRPTEKEFMEWTLFNPKDERLENHCSYLVTDAVIVATGYFDCGEFVGCDEDMIGKVTHWMPFPSPPEK